MARTRDFAEVIRDEIAADPALAALVELARVEDSVACEQWEDARLKAGREPEARPMPLTFDPNTVPLMRREPI